MARLCRQSLLGVVLVLTGFSALGRAAAAKVYLRESTASDGQPLVLIGNPFMELTFEPRTGGRCATFRFKDDGEEIVGKGNLAGLFKDHWAKYPWPSGLMWLPYEYEIVGDRTSEIGIRLWVKVPAQGGGKGEAAPEASRLVPTSPDLVGLLVRKTIRLRADTDLVQVEQEVENPTSESRGVAPYIQHAFNLGGGERLHDTWYLPSPRGVVVNLQPDTLDGKALGADWVLSPTEGWIAVRDRETRRGLLFAFDYNYLQKIYTCGSSAEWFYEAVPVAPGKAFRTRYVIKPVYGFEDFVHGSERLVADIRPDEVRGQVRIYHDLAAVSADLRDLAVDIELIGWKSKEQIGQAHGRIRKLGAKKVRQEFSFHVPNLADGIVIRVSVNGPEVQERYEVYYAGDKDAHERRYSYFANQGGALAGGQGDAYYRTPPHKVKHFDKPDLATVARPPPERFRCLVVFGLYTHILNLDDALAGWRYRGQTKAEFTWANCPPNAVETFPGSYEELFAYNAVILSDANYRAIGDIGFEMLCDYVEQGGALLVAGGPYALGNGEFEGTRFPSVLPVTLSGPFDLTWAGAGRSWPLAAAPGTHAVLEGVPLDAAASVFWRHAVVAKPDAEVPLLVGGTPALALGTYGKGRVAVWTPSPTGLAAAGETAWWDWPGWPKLLGNVMTWLSAPP